MRILTVFPHHPVIYGRFITEALERLGHDVKHIGEAKHDNGWNKDSVNPDYLYPPDDLPVGWSPDLVVNMDEYVRPKPQRIRPFAKAPHVVYSASNNVCDLHTLTYNHTFIALYRGPALPYRNDGTLTWIGCGYDPTLHIPSPIPWEERAYDVCFIGSTYNQRAAALGRLRGAGVRVYQSMGEMYGEYVARYHDSRMALCCAGDYPGPNMRTYEAPAMGCLPLLARDSYERRWRADDALGWYDDIVETVNHYLAHPGEAKALVDRAMIWVKPHTWDARAGDILQWYRRAHSG